jgi:hypothetical protein
MAGNENETEDGEYLEGLTMTPDERKEVRALVPLPTKPEPERVVPPFPLAAYLVMLDDTPDEYR